MREILCDNVFCVYWNNNCCILRKVTHDALGVCTQGIHIDIDEKFLEKKRIDMLKRFRKNDEYLQ